MSFCLCARPLRSLNLPSPLAVFFALYRSIPGDLIITPTRIRFSSTRGLRTISLLGGRLAKKLAARRTADGIPAELSDTESVRSVAVAESGYAVDLSVDEIVGVKKESRFRFEGLLMTTRSGEVGLRLLALTWAAADWCVPQVLRLANVSDRDDAFNKLLSVTPTSL